jgi:hypothetical protein
MKNNDGGAAFHAVTCIEGDNYNRARLVYHKGMSLRDYFASQALSGLLTQPAEPEFGAMHFAISSYEMADAMLEARKKFYSTKES